MNKKCCNHCDDGDGECAYPYYGVAPHHHNDNGCVIGSTILKHESKWPKNFTEDPEAKGLGTYTHCLDCGMDNGRGTVKTIYKYQLSAVERQSIYMPEGAEVLTVQDQNGALCLWALIDSDNSQSERIIYMVGTGHKINTEKGNYVGTIQSLEGALILHVFEKEIAGERESDGVSWESLVPGS